MFCLISVACYKNRNGMLSKIHCGGAEAGGEEGVGEGDGNVVLVTVRG